VKEYTSQAKWGLGYLETYCLQLGVKADHGTNWRVETIRVQGRRGHIIAKVDHVHNNIKGANYASVLLCELVVHWESEYIVPAKTIPRGH
jgi:hypothetical protein